MLFIFVNYHGTTHNQTCHEIDSRRDNESKGATYKTYLVSNLKSQTVVSETYKGIFVYEIDKFRFGPSKGVT